MEVVEGKGESTKSRANSTTMNTELGTHYEEEDENDIVSNYEHTKLRRKRQARAVKERQEFVNRIKETLVSPKIKVKLDLKNLTAHIPNIKMLQY